MLTGHIGPFIGPWIDGSLLIRSSEMLVLVGLVSIRNRANPSFTRLALLITTHSVGWRKNTLVIDAAPVWPYVKMVMLYPSKELCIRLLHSSNTSACAMSNTWLQIVVLIYSEFDIRNCNKCRYINTYNPNTRANKRIYTLKITTCLSWRYEVMIWKWRAYLRDPLRV